MSSWQTAAGVIIALVIVVLAILRLREGRRLLFRAAERWSRLPAHRTAIVLAALAIAMLLGFQSDGANSPYTAPLITTNQPAEWELLGAAPGAGGNAEPDSVFELEGSEPKERALASLRDFASRVEERRSVIDKLGLDEPAQTTQASLPDVDTMIERLRARLNSHPTDVKGWTTLGWAYANTGKYQEAVEAYETALRLDADNLEIGAALNDVKNKASNAIQRGDSK